MLKLHRPATRAHFVLKQKLSRCASSHATTLTDELKGVSEVAAEMITLEDKHGAHNYHPLPVVLSSGKG